MKVREEGIIVLVGIVSSKTDKKIAFGNIREDYYNIDYLAGGENAIVSNRKKNILSAIHRFSKDSSDSNIQFLLDTASSLQYGVKPNSEFTKQLGIKDVSSMENTDWYGALDRAIKRAMQSSDSPEKGDFSAQYLDIFGSNESLSEQEKEILQYREEILSSAEMKNAINSPENLAYSADIANYLDYFLASSEISKTQKHHCLKQMAYFLSPEYEINPQLKDKKLQALSEILNDLLVKTPDNPVLTTKEMDQRETGMCGAISIKKALAYEDKSRYVDITLEELNSSNQMEVFDVTKLGTDAKVKVNKADIDYEAALSRGYRIIDASIHNWMHIAQSAGDGKVQGGEYIPFDTENKGIFHDSVLYRKLTGKAASIQEFIRFLIKEKEVISRIEKNNAAQEKLVREMPAIRKNAEHSMEVSRSRMIKIIKDLYPDAPINHPTKLVSSLLNSQEHKTVAGMKRAEEFNLREPEDVLKGKIKSHILLNSSSETISHSIDEDLSELCKLFVEYKTSEKSLSKLSDNKTPIQEFYKAADLYKLALIHRNAVFADLAIEGRIIDYERKLKIPPIESLFNRHMDQLRESLSDPQRVIYWATKLKVPPNKADVEAKFAELQTSIDVEIPHSVDVILSKIAVGDRVHFLRSSLDGLRKQVEAGDKHELRNAAAVYNCKPEKQDILAKISQDEKSLENPDNETIMAVARNFDFDFESDIARITFDTILGQLRAGNKEMIGVMLDTYKTEKALNSAFSKLVSDINQTIQEESRILDLVELPERYENIVSMYENDEKILTEKELDTLRAKFESVRQERLKREIAEERGEKEDKSVQIYMFSPEEKKLLKKIENNVAKYRKYAICQYKDMNELIAPEIEELYASNGRRFGSFWVLEEGHSGLSYTQQIRIFEQMRGKSYYKEPDVDIAVDKIKKGYSTGTLTTSVYDDEFAMHAQYVPGVSSVRVVDGTTKKAVRKDVLWQDNSWGYAEDKELWKDSLGNKYTSYGKGYGGKGGYILAKDHKIGKTVDFFRSTYGLHKEDGDKVSQFFYMLLPGQAKGTVIQLAQLYDSVFSLSSTEGDLDDFENLIKQGISLNFDRFSQKEEAISQRVDEFMKKIDEKTLTREEFEALPMTDSIRLMVEKQTLISSLDDVEFIYWVKSASTYQDFVKVKDNIVKQQRELLYKFLNKDVSSISTLLQLTVMEDLKALFKKFEEENGTNLGGEEEILALFNIADSNFDGSYEDMKKQLAVKAKEFVSLKVNNPELAEEFTKKIVDIERGALDENLRFDSLESFINSYASVGKNIVALIDEIYEPKNNKELMEHIKKLQDMKKEEFEEFISKVPKDFGLGHDDSYKTLQKLQSGNFFYRSDFRDTVYKSIRKVFYNDVRDVTVQSPENKLIDKSYEMTNDLSFLEPQKILKRLKRRFFESYKVLPAFPKTVIYTDEQIEEPMEENLMNLEGLYREASSFHKIKIMMDLAEQFRNMVDSQDFDKQKLSDKLTEIYAVSSLDSDMKELNGVINAALKELSKEDGEFDRSKVDEQISTINNLFYSLSVSVCSPENIASGAKNINDVIDGIVNLIINGEVACGYRDSVRRDINIWRREFIKDENSESTEQAYNKVLDDIKKRHITTEPNKLFEEYVKILQDDNADENLKTTYKSNMITTLNTAKRAKVEYLLMELASEGLATKLPLLQGLYHYKTSDGQIIDITSDIGLLKLVGALSSGNDRSLLQLFLIQTGLTDRAVDVITGAVDFEAVKDSFRSVTENLFVHINFMVGLSNLIENFYKDNKIQYDTIESANNHWLKYLDNNKDMLLKGDVNDVAQSMLDSYVDSMKTGVKSFNEKLCEKDMLKPLMQLHLFFYEKMLDSINDSLAYYKSMQKYYKCSGETVESLEVSSPDVNMKKREYQKNIDEMIQFFESEYQKLLKESEKVGTIEN